MLGECVSVERKGWGWLINYYVGGAASIAVYILNYKNYIPGTLSPAFSSDCEDLFFGRVLPLSGGKLSPPAKSLSLLLSLLKKPLNLFFHDLLFFADLPSTCTNAY